MTVDVEILETRQISSEVVPKKGWLLLVVVLLGWGAVALAHGSYPGLTRDAPSEFLFEGQVMCLAHTSWVESRAVCPDIGLTMGGPVMGGLPYVLLASGIQRVTSFDSSTSMLILSLILDLVAFLGGWLLFKSWGIHRWVAPMASLAYQMGIGVLAMASYGGTFWGFVLMPTTVWLYQYGSRRITSSSVWSGARVLTLMAATATLALFMDGYSFVVAALCFLTIEIVDVIQIRPGLGIAATRIGVFFSAQVIAVALFRLYIPGGASFAYNPVEIFRAMGADLVTLVSPTQYVWLADLLGHAGDYSDLWGDGGNSQFNYIGIVVLALALGSLFIRVTRQRAIALAFLAGVTLLLAIGPSVKINETRPPIDGNITFQDYLMPPEVAALDLPWSIAFPETPGINEMRATYRWLVGTKLALLGMAALTVTAGIQGQRKPLRIATVAVGALAFLELAPNMPLMIDRYRSQEDVVEKVGAEVAAPLKSLAVPGETVLYLPSGNDYLATFLTPSAGIRSFNIGGDKNNELSRKTWPNTIVAASNSPTPDTIQAALSTSAEAVIITYFDLRWNAYSFPPTDEQQRVGRTLVQQLQRDPRFTVKEDNYFALVRLAG